MDIGGTFTDVVADIVEAGSYAAGTACTNPRDVTEGVFAALAQVVEDAPELGLCVHGTTVGLNAFLQRRGGGLLRAATGGAPPEVVSNPGRPDEQRRLKSAAIARKRGDIVRGAR